MLDRKQVVDKSNSEASKAIFKELHTILKAIKGRGKNTANLIEGANAIKVESNKREYVRLLGMVLNFVSIKSQVSVDDISFENLKRISTLVTKVDKHFKKDYSKLSKLNEVKYKGASYSRYNNDIEKVCATIKSELTLPKAVKVYEYEEAHKILESMASNDRRLLLEDLLKEFQEEEEREVA